ncbi:hypothetical protein [Streptomyces sp. NPDC054865]
MTVFVSVDEEGVEEVVGLGIGQSAGNVGLCEDADETVAVDDRQTAYLVLLMMRMISAASLSALLVTASPWARSRLGGVLSGTRDLHHDVAVSQHP